MSASTTVHGLPPGPRWPKLVQAVAFGRDPTGFLERCAAKYGEPFTVRMPNDAPRVIVSDPVSVKVMFALRPDAYRSDDIGLHLNLGRESLLFQDGLEHRRFRKLMTPMLQARRLGSYADAMLAATRDNLATWPTDEPFEVLPQMSAIALDVIIRCVLGAEGREADELRRQVLAWLRGVLSPGLFLTGVMINAYRLRRMLDRGVDMARAGDKPRVLAGVAQAKAQLLATLQARIERCRAAPDAEGDDVLSLLVAARDEDGQPLTNEQILDQLITMLVGGHETTGNALAWTLSLVLRRPEVLARIREELAEHFGEGVVDAMGTRKLAYLDACIRESMRLRPISPGPFRTLTVACEIPGYVLPPGTAIWASTYLAHRRADDWEDPSVFRPERFLGDEALRLDSYFPFGGGARRCVGALFAEFEMRIVLAQILQTLDLQPTQKPPAPMFAGISLSPSDGVPVLATRR